MELPVTQGVFEKMFATEEQCIEYFIGLKYKDGFQCPACGHDKYWLLSRRRIGCTQCKKKWSITSGTILE